MTKTELEKLEELANDLECMRESSFSREAYAAYDGACVLIYKTIAALKNGSETKKTQSGEVLVRTQSDETYVGTFELLFSNIAVLGNARRFMFLCDTIRLSTIATKGVDRKTSRISAGVPEITITHVVEMIPVSPGVDLSSTEN